MDTYTVPEPSSRRSILMVAALAAVVVVLAAAFLILNSGDGSSPVTAGASPGVADVDKPTEVSEECGLRVSDPSDVEALQSEYDRVGRVLVVGPNGEPEGYVNLADWNAPRDWRPDFTSDVSPDDQWAAYEADLVAKPPTVFACADDAAVGYWIHNFGYVSEAEFADPLFSVESVVLSRNGDKALADWQKKERFFELWDKGDEGLTEAEQAEWDVLLAEAFDQYAGT